MPELLIPAGSLDVVKTAVRYGADAVYVGGEAFGLRAKAKNLSFDELREAVAYCHERGKKLYVATNVIAHEGSMEAFLSYLEKIGEIRPVDMFPRTGHCEVVVSMSRVGSKL